LFDVDSHLCANNTISSGLLSFEEIMAWFWQKTREAPSSDADFHVLCCVNGTESLVSLSGKITIDSSPDLRMQLLKSLESPGCRTLTADVFEVSYIDTSGLAVIRPALPIGERRLRLPTTPGAILSCP